MDSFVFTTTILALSHDELPSSQVNHTVESFFMGIAITQGEEHQLPNKGAAAEDALKRLNLPKSMTVQSSTAIGTLSGAGCSVSVTGLGQKLLLALLTRLKSPTDTNTVLLHLH